MAVAATKGHSKGIDEAIDMPRCNACRNLCKFSPESTGLLITSHLCILSPGQKPVPTLRV